MIGLIIDTNGIKNTSIIFKKTMTTPIKFTDDEIKQIKEIQTKYQEKTFVFGQIQLERFGIQERVKELDTLETTTKDEYLKIQEQEKNLFTKLTDKYGEGSLNISDGTFSPADTNK